jgi:hypothetical protein
MEFIQPCTISYSDPTLENILEMYELKHFAYYLRIINTANANTYYHHHYCYFMINL